MLLRAHNRLTAVLEHELQAERQLPLVWYDVLVQLSQHGGSLRMNELARAVMLSKSGLTRLVDRLCAAGLVTRSADPGDRRGRRVTLTTDGDHVLRRAAPVHLRGIAEHFTDLLSDEEAAELAALLARIIEPLSECHPVP
jgi:DNA-binding MarR family transcriptional regulator